MSFSISNDIDQNTYDSNVQCVADVRRWMENHYYICEIHMPIMKVIGNTLKLFFSVYQTRRQIFQTKIIENKY